MERKKKTRTLEGEAKEKLYEKDVKRSKTTRTCEGGMQEKGPV